MEDDTVVDDFPEQDQRAAVCNSQWRRAQNSVITIENRASTYTVHNDTLEGRDHLVVPVTILVEGVHNGSNGPVYYPPEVLARTADAWNGVPVPVYHPIDKDGEPSLESCNSPSVINRQVIGRLFNVHYFGGKVKGEIWLDSERVRELAPDVYDKIQNGEMIEVSTGFMPLDLGPAGTWNGEDYSSSVLDLRPDHLAILPDERGACSVDDGCGIRNKEGEAMLENVNNPSCDGTEFKIENSVLAKLATMLVNQMSLTEKHEKIARALDAMDTVNRIHFLEELYDDYLIYRVAERNSPTSPEFFRADYSINESDGTVNFGDPIKVQKKVEYVTVNAAPMPCNDQKRKKGGNGMSNEEKCPIDELIANEVTDYTEDDRADLEKIDKAMLERIVKNLETTPAPVKTEDPEPDPDPKPDESAEPTLNEYIENAPASIQDFLKSGVAMSESRKAELIETITNAEGNKFTADDLKTKSLEDLEATAALINQAPAEDKSDGPGFYAGAEGVSKPSGTDPEPLTAPTMADMVPDK
jgi:hypothetical protein